MLTILSENNIPFCIFFWKFVFSPPHSSVFFENCYVWCLTAMLMYDGASLWLWLISSGEGLSHTENFPGNFWHIQALREQLLLDEGLRCMNRQVSSHEKSVGSERGREWSTQVEKKHRWRTKRQRWWHSSPWFWWVFYYLSLEIYYSYFIFWSFNFSVKFSVFLSELKFNFRNFWTK